MGDLNSHSRLQTLEPTNGYARDGPQGFGPPSTSPYKHAPDSTPFYSQLSSLPNVQMHPDNRTSAHSSVQALPQQPGLTSLSMSSIAGALPGYGAVEDTTAPYGSHAIPRSNTSGSTPINGYQATQHVNVPVHNSGSMPSHSPYDTTYPMGPYQQPAFGYSNHSRMAPGPSMSATFQNYAQPSPYMYYSAPYGQYNTDFGPSTLQNPNIYERKDIMPNANGGVLNPQYLGYQGHARFGLGGMQGDSQVDRVQGKPHASSTSSIPRGPPRKPKQSGHALWVGNLPSATTVLALKDHFSREATKDIDSVFLISKSNCCFINYKSEAACAAAMQRFHDSRFNGVRLVCRLRRSSAPGSGVPTGPSAMVGSQSSSLPPRVPIADADADDQPQDGTTEPAMEKDGIDVTEGSSSSSKYFIVKSLTLQDLELSVRNEIWATQSHNEDILNKAFKTTENVFLIFSANKSGEYFGYARMTSPILEDGSQVVGTAPKTEILADAHDVPKSIPTPATEWAPKGKIIDDSARGTIFWEAELPESEVDEDTQKKEEKVVNEDDTAVAQSWGKPFKIEWVSTNRLPFYRTRGLRNPWNANREVKIARDGTELEPSVGERLVAMFHRIGPSNNGPPMMPLHPQMLGHGIPQMRPF